MKTINLVVIARSNRATIGTCLELAKPMVREMIVVDTGSTDDTAEIAQSMGAKVFHTAWTENFSAARNYALEQSEADYNLILDTDEFIRSEGQTALEEFLREGPPDKIGRIQIFNKFDDQGEIKTYQEYLSRIIPRGVRFKGRVHEQIDSPLERVNLQVKVDHDGYLKSNRGDRNLKLLKLELQEDDCNPYLLYQLAKEYKIREEHLAAFQSLRNSYRFLSKNESYYPNVITDLIYAAIKTEEWDTAVSVIERERERLVDYPDFWFSCGIFFMYYASRDPETLREVELSFKKCLAIGDTEKYSSVVGTGGYLALYNLGVFYEATGDLMSAYTCYGLAAQAQNGYHRAAERMKTLEQTLKTPFTAM